MRLLQGDDEATMKAFTTFCQETISDILPNYMTPDGVDITKLTAKVRAHACV